MTRMRLQLAFRKFFQDALGPGRAAAFDENEIAGPGDFPRSSAASSAESTDVLLSLSRPSARHAAIPRRSAPTAMSRSMPNDAAVSPTSRWPRLDSAPSSRHLPEHGDPLAVGRPVPPACAARPSSNRDWRCSCRR